MLVGWSRGDAAVIIVVVQVLQVKQYTLSMKFITLLFCLVLFFSCSKDDPLETGADTETPTEPDSGNDPDSDASTIYPNILIIIADDMGKDATPGFSEGSIKPNTPHLNELMSNGLTFTNFWTNPTCSPTRAAILTGKYGYRTDVKWANDQLAASETILHNYINQNSQGDYATALVGKWHLSGEESDINPEIFGMDYYAGLIRGAASDYYSWRLYENGNSSREEIYITEKITDLAIDWVEQQESPWLLWLAYNAPHTPLHVPPENMHSQGTLPDYEEDVTDPIPYYMAAIEAMDYQIGRLLDELTTQEKENTLIFFLGDNGTPNSVAQSPYSFRKVKGTLYEGGVNTPLIVSGKGVSRTGVDNNLINNTDLFATIATLSGVSVENIHDSQNFSSLLTESGSHRNFIYTEMENENDDLWTIRDDTYKLIVNANGETQMYNLSADPYESNDLLQSGLTTTQENAKTALEAEIGNIRN